MSAPPSRRARRVLRRLRGCILAAALIAALEPFAPASAQSDLELRVKAAFLYNFARFTTWPPGKLGAKEPIVFCVMAGEPLLQVLQDTLNGKTIDEHATVVRSGSRPEDFRACHLLYADSMADPKRLPALLDALAGSGILTVCDGELAPKTGAIRFYIEDRKLRFEVNPKTLDREGLVLSSKLLSVARAVRE